MLSTPSPTNTTILLTLALLVGANIYQGSRLTALEASLAESGNVEANGATKGQIYVPAYSHIYSADGLPVLLGITLSLRNISTHRSVTIDQVDYFDDQGKLLQRFLELPIALGPLNSKEYSIALADYRGGMGANFLITWHSTDTGSAPLAEAVMTGGDSAQPVTLNSRGIATARRPTMSTNKPDND